jgi:hypothetical protein
VERWHQRLGRRWVRAPSFDEHVVAMGEQRRGHVISPAVLPEIDNLS